MTIEEDLVTEGPCSGLVVHRLSLASDAVLRYRILQVNVQALLWLARSLSEVSEF